MSDVKTASENKPSVSDFGRMAKNFAAAGLKEEAEDAVVSLVLRSLEGYIDRAVKNAENGDRVGFESKLDFQAQSPSGANTPCIIEQLSVDSKKRVDEFGAVAAERCSAVGLKFRQTIITHRRVAAALGFSFQIMPR